MLTVHLLCCSGNCELIGYLKAAEEKAHLLTPPVPWLLSAVIVKVSSETPWVYNSAHGSFSSLVVGTL